LPPLQKAVVARLFSLLPEDGPTFDWLTAWSKYLSPYDLNPLNINPLKDLIERFVDFEGLRADARPLFIAATNVQTGRLHVFTREKISAEAAPHRAGRPGRAVFLCRALTQRQQIVRSVAQARSPRGAAVFGRALRRCRRALEHRSEGGARGGVIAALPLRCHGRACPGHLA
jgi:hypothetical protein